MSKTSRAFVTVAPPDGCVDEKFMSGTIPSESTSAAIRQRKVLIFVIFAAVPICA